MPGRHGPPGAVHAARHCLGHRALEHAAPRPADAGLDGLDACRVRLLVRVVARSHHRAHGGVGEAHLVGFLFVHLERIRMHVAAHRQVAVGRREVLADGQHVDVVRAHVAHHLQDLLVGLAQAHHDAALGGHAGMQRLELLEQVQAELVVGARACFLVEARRGLEVVVHHVGRRGLEDLQRTVVAAAEVGHQDLDLRLGRERADVLDALHEVAAAAVAQVVAVHAGDHHVLQLERGDGAREVQRFVLVQRVRPAVAHVAERAAARALVAHDHERGRALAEAFADVGAGGLLAHRVQLVLAQDLLDFIEARGGRAGLDADPLGFLQHLALLHLDGDARKLRGSLLLGERVVGDGGLRFAHDFGSAHGWC